MRALIFHLEADGGQRSSCWVSSLEFWRPNHVGGNEHNSNVETEISGHELSAHLLNSVTVDESVWSQVKGGERIIGPGGDTSMKMTNRSHTSLTETDVHLAEAELITLQLLISVLPGVLSESPPPGHRWSPHVLDGAVRPSQSSKCWWCHVKRFLLPETTVRELQNLFNFGRSASFSTTPQSRTIGGGRPRLRVSGRLLSTTQGRAVDWKLSYERQ